MAAAKLVVSRAQGEYEQLEKEREDQEAGLGKRGLEDGQGGPTSKRARRDEDEDEMEIEMEDDEDGECNRALLPMCRLTCSTAESERKWGHIDMYKSTGRVHRGDYGGIVFTVSQSLTA